MNEWNAESEELPEPRGLKLWIRKDRFPLTFAEVVKLLKGDARFREFLNGALAEMQYHAFRWETQPVRRSTANRPFECVALDSPDLRRPPEPDAFQAQFGGLRAPEVLGFPNLGNDAFMVVPCPGVPLSAYAHLGAFVRRAPKEQRDRLWRQVGEALDARLGTDPVWLNTAGGGVAWLHVRLDRRPKYYCYAPYRGERL